MKFKKLVATGLAAVMMLGTLAGCGGNPSNNQETTTSDRKSVV